ncbi:Hint domain-containing protein [Sagittula sp. SSi028]|uniref:Hint domain-containing protein n=1 Tax=Sagittula sp. SSi028 TaxID=3400636 RepID=UPI003AF7C28E
MIIEAYAPDALTFDAPSNSWTLRADFDPALHLRYIDITDDDPNFDGDGSNDEVGSDPDQTGIVRDAGGTALDSGQIYDEAFYAVFDGVTTIWLERVEIGGRLVGYFASGKMTPGQAYTVSASEQGDASPAAYSSFATLACFDAATLIETADGPIRAERIREGDLVMTRDYGAQPVRWVHRSRRAIDPDDRHKAPVLLPKGSLGRNRPSRDLILSANHRVLLGEAGQFPVIGLEEEAAGVLVPCKSLIGWNGIRKMPGRQHADWCHFALDRHSVVVSNGACTETLLLGPQIISGLNLRQMAEIRGRFLYPLRIGDPWNGPPARPLLTTKQGRVWLRRQDALLRHARQLVNLAQPPETQDGSTDQP